MAKTVHFDPNALVDKNKSFTVTSSQAERQERKRNPHEEPDQDDTLQGVEAAFRRAAENRKKIKTRNV